MSKFSKVDYVSVAALIDSVWAECDSAGWHEPKDIFDEVVTAFADMYEADNPRFDRQRFVEACEGAAIQEED